MSKVALITGTSSGLGISIAVKLAHSGAKVYATMRNLKKQEKLWDAARAAGVTLEVSENLGMGQ